MGTVVPIFRRVETIPRWSPYPMQGYTVLMLADDNGRHVIMDTPAEALWDGDDIPAWNLVWAFRLGFTGVNESASTMTFHASNPLMPRALERIANHKLQQRTLREWMCLLSGPDLVEALAFHKPKIPNFFPGSWPDLKRRALPRLKHLEREAA